MAGAAVEIDLREFTRMFSSVRRASNRAARREELMHGIASLLETQTKRRISDEKESPEGVAWKPWSDDYAKTRGPQHSLLIDTQNLLDSIYGTAERNSATVGTEVVYAGAQNAERPFLGLSAENRSEIDAVVEDWLRGLVA